MKNILICNRGEIAYRALEACKKLKLRSFVIANDSEKETLLAQEADKLITFSDAINPFTNLDIIEKLVGQYQIDAIYPGYGFLSEDSRLAKLCEDLGIAFIGPRSETLSALSSKRECMSFAKKCQFEVLKIDEEDIKLKDFPLMLKASLGGGGRGNSIVKNSDDFNSEMQELKKRSLSLFQDDDIIVERYLPTARHIELQIFATKNKVFFLSSRDCSLQRNYQKFMEEGPAEDLFNQYIEKKYPHIERTLLELGYLGAGTIEFLWDRENEEAYFLEVNTRIQVEHTVTELLYDIDLVKAQFELALGEKISFDQRLNGHSICCRIYAVDSRHDFLPDPGRIHHFSKESFMRFDTFIKDEGVISHQYDPLIGKLMVHGKTRQQAIDKAIKALEELVIHGVCTNKDYLLATLKNEEYRQDKHHVSWAQESFETHWSSSFEDSSIEENELLPIWNEILKKSSDSSSRVCFGKMTHKDLSYHYSINDNTLWLERCHDGEVLVTSAAHSFWREDFAKKERAYASPITGKVVDLFVSLGDTVSKGQTLVSLEAMKTLVEIKALKDGEVTCLNIVKDGLVDQGQVVLDIE
ncbi:biotin carboxylase N-terminal domain-containing protein [Bacteriovorax sp. DB6_IX]|uniref:ATP-binding protein n=1 Tax=Bacteriovorax sp. DB6_IX TaxID=1353530 RepID=UPI00038A461E|nr:biotin carboxylase N-terminal domain-containing protein [Bacteriovorax sp. DB6_IX]EQC51554.1 ATP-grasp domain protein [Bacteriovorax sp. DB6_IX]